MAILRVLALPVLGLRLGFSDEGNYPEDTTTRQAYDLLAEGFGPGFNGPLVLASEVPEGTDPAALQAVSDAIQADPGVAVRQPADPQRRGDPTAALWRVIPTTAPQDAETTDLVNRLRDDVLPAATDGTGLDVAVAGAVAIGVDFTEYLAERLPWFFAAVLGLSFLLLMVVFRSLLVPLKAVVMNLLSIGAAYGVVVAVFQWGWGGALLGIEGGPDRAVRADDAVRHRVRPVDGLRGVPALPHPGGVGPHRRQPDRRWPTAWPPPPGSSPPPPPSWSWSSAASSASPTGSSSCSASAWPMAVLLDATIVRMLLVPATMELLGDRNWWLPGWLDRILPKIHIEAPADLDAELAQLSEEEQARTGGAS